MRDGHPTGRSGIGDLPGQGRADPSDTSPIPDGSDII
ncbi:hypothetical protein GA0074692_5408 [Micromonospora pallida]|uniref:Uncharacterized protein n=1 Tax=Micromonospora pallida TaxID=145854 RepID=A0A1C6TCN2_9ACTN|nr:hypothetical protein GA0074692_5408 [Micromonospora pallida]